MARIVRERVLGTKLSPPQKNTQGAKSGRKTSASSLVSFSLVLAVALSFGALQLHAKGVDIAELASRPGVAILAAHKTLSDTFGSSLAAVGGQFLVVSDQQSALSLQPSAPAPSSLAPSTSSLAPRQSSSPSPLAPSPSSPSLSFLASSFQLLVSRIGYSLSFIACSFEEGSVWENLSCQDADERGYGDADERGLSNADERGLNDANSRGYDERPTSSVQSPASSVQPPVSSSQPSAPTPSSLAPSTSSLAPRPSSSPSNPSPITSFIVSGVQFTDLSDLEKKLTAQIRAARESSRSNRSRSDASPRPTFLTLSDTFDTFSAYTIPFTNTESNALTYASTFVYKDNKLGVASSTPTETLSVNGNAHIAGYLTLDQVSAPSPSTNRLYNTGGDLYWAGSLIGGATTGNWTSDGTNVWRASGKVGIANASPSYPLDVTGMGRFSGLVDASHFVATSTTASSFPYASSTALTVSGTAYINALSSASAIPLTAGYTLRGGAGNTAEATSSLFVGASGNVGIGTTNPGAKLDVTSSVPFASRITGPANVYIDITDGTGTFRTQLLSNTPFLTSVGAFDLIFGTNNTERMRILRTGNVGIGTTNPQYKLEVNGSASTTNFYMPNTTSSALGVIYKGTDRFMHNYADPTSDGNNTFIGVNAGNFTMGPGGGASYLSSINVGFGNNALASLTTGYNNAAFGYSALYSNTTGPYNMAFGNNALYSNTTGGNNNAFGLNSLRYNTAGNWNTAFGDSSLRSNTTGSSNTANGALSLYSNTTGYSNTGSGMYALYYNTSATNTTALGYAAGQGTAAYSNQGGVYVGYQAGYSAGTGSDYNSMLGYQSGYGVTTGANNILLGYNAGYSGTNLTTGSNNIIIGNNIGATSSDQTRGLNIGNLIFGTNLDGSGTTLSTGNVGIGNSAPIVKLHVGSTAITDGVSLMRLEDTNSTCDFTANSGSPSCGSDRSLKKNIETLSGSLEKIAQLRLVSYNWQTDTEGQDKQTGFIAQEVRDIFPSLVSERKWIDGSTKLFLNTGALVPYLAGAIAELNLKVADMANATTSIGIMYKYEYDDAGVITKTISYFKDTLEALEARFEKLFAKEAHVEKLCVGETCITEADLKELLEEKNGGEIGGGANEQGEQSSTEIGDMAVETGDGSDTTSSSGTEDVSSVTSPSPDNQVDAGTGDTSVTPEDQSSSSDSGEATGAAATGEGQVLP